MKARKRKSTRTPPPSSGMSIYDVARQAGVSIVTVSRVFNDYPHVSQRMRDRVFAAARAVGYTPRLVSKPNVLAVVVGHLDHLGAGDYKTRLLLNLVQAAAEAGYLVEFIPSGAVDLATKHLVDGIMEVGLTDAEARALDHLPNVPFVMINKQKVRPDWSSVSSDHFLEGRLATRHLVDNGHRRIALVVDDPAGWGVEQRRAGYLQALRDATKAGCQPLIFSTADTPPEQIARRMLEFGCTGCVNLADNFGFAILDCWVGRLGKRIPDDLSVVCLENKAVSPFWNPPLTCIEQPLQALAEAVVRGALDLRGRPAARFDRLIKCRLIERKSVRDLK